MDIKLQKQFFNLRRNQYQQKLILNPPYHTRLEITEMINRLPKNTKSPVIDFGCGSGRLTIPLLQSGYSVLAVDISQNSLVELKKTTSKLFQNSKILSQLKLSTTWPKKKFAIIVGIDILHHINLDEYLPSFYRVLTRGGKIVFSEPGAFNLSWYIYLPLFYDWQVEKGVASCSYFNIKRKLRKYGFRDIKITGLGLFPRPFFNFSKNLCRLNDYLGRLPLLNLFAYRYIIEAKTL